MLVLVLINVLLCGIGGCASNTPFYSRWLSMILFKHRVDMQHSTDHCLAAGALG